MAKLLLPFIFLAITSCQKEDPNNLRVLEIGTKCNIYDGIFAPGDFQPAQPVTVISVYRKAESGLIYYNVQDTKGVIWQIPDNDLKVSK